MSKIEELLKYVSEHNDYYKKIISIYGITDFTDITQYPVITRSQLQKNRYNMFSDGYKSKYFNQQLRRQSSSGTSGVPVNVYWDFKDWHVSNLALWRRRLHWYGVHPSDKYVMFTLNGLNVKADNKKIFFEKKYNNILLINLSLMFSSKDYLKIIDLIEAFKPKWLFIQPFILQNLIYWYKNSSHVIPDSIKYIESVGSLLSNDLRKKAIEIFKVPIANMYGSEEANCIAYECPCHHMHILNENIIVRCQNRQRECKDSNTGEAIITSLTNKAMPLINYNQEDEIILKHLSEPCLYDSGSNVISLIKGRVLECIHVNDEIELNALMLLEIMGEVINQYGSIILEYKFIYKEATHELKCYINIDQKNFQWYPNVKKSIERVFASKLTSKIKSEINFEVSCENSILSFGRKQRIIEKV